MNICFPGLCILIEQSGFFKLDFVFSDELNYKNVNFKKSVDLRNRSTLFFNLFIVEL